MVNEPIIECIDPDLEVLLERFFVNSREDVVGMRQALDKLDYETLARLGHTAKGTGHGYGFAGMGEIGLQLEQAAKGCDAVECGVWVERMAHYLDHVKVEFSE